MSAESLNVISGEKRGTSIALDGELVIGRSNAALGALRGDTEISRVHARVWRSDTGELMVEDLGSRNGTYVNGMRVDGPRVLRPGDWLLTGHTTMELVENGAGDGAPSYDALVEEDEPTLAARAPAGAAGHIRPWPLAAVLAALLAGGGIGAAVAASHREAAKTRSVVIMRTVERPAPPPRLSSPARAAQLPPPIAPAAAQLTANPQATYPVAARDVFVHSFCGAGGTAPKGVCACTYSELTRREPYGLLLAQVARSYGGRVAPAIARAARSCGAAA